MRTKFATRKSQTLFLEAYKNNFFNISAAAKTAGVTRRTYYYWIEHCTEFVELLEDLHTDQIKYVEKLAFQRMESGSDKLIEFYLKTKGKKAGYGEEKEENKFTFKVIVEDTKKKEE